jgi:hypothetical protein
LDGKEFTLTSPNLPLELRTPAFQDGAMSDEIRAAMKAALAGDFAPLDKLELEHLNLRVRIGELVVTHPDGTPHWWFDKRDRRWLLADREVNAPFVVGLVRGYTREGKTALEWALHEKCRRCDGKLRRLPCRVCEGRWYVEDMSDHELVYTDIDGVLIEEGA